MGETAKRLVWSVRWSKTDRSWIVEDPDEVVDKYARKVNAVARGRMLARDSRQSEGTPTQLRVFGKNGRIQFEWTYGRDPRRYPG